MFFFFSIFFYGTPGAGGALGNKTWKAPAAHQGYKAHYVEARRNCDETRGASYPLARLQTNVLMFCCQPLAPALSPLRAVQGRGEVMMMMMKMMTQCAIKGLRGRKLNKTK